MRKLCAKTFNISTSFKVSGMSGKWKCRNCSLLNYNNANECMACFAYNPAKGWPCGNCDFINKKSSSKCDACYYIPQPLIEIDNKWDVSYLNINNVAQRRIMRGNVSSFKMIYWNDKLYTIAIDTKNVELPEEIEVICTDHSKNAQNTKVDINRPEPDERWELQNCEFAMNRNRGELYIFIKAERLDESYTNRIYNINCNLLIIYDLTAQKIASRYLLKADDAEKGWKSWINGAKHIAIVYNDDEEEEAKRDEYDIINYWVRKGCLADVPIDVYILINRFYSYYARPNSFQLVIFTKQPVLDASGYDKHYDEYKIYHILVDLDEADKDNNIEMEILQQKSLGQSSDRMPDVYNFSYLFRTGYKVSVVHGRNTWITDLKTADCYSSKSINVFTKGCIPTKGGPLIYDSCRDWNDRYLYMIMRYFQRYSKTVKQDLVRLDTSVEENIREFSVIKSGISIDSVAEGWDTCVDRQTRNNLEMDMITLNHDQVVFSAFARLEQRVVYKINMNTD